MEVWKRNLIICWIGSFICVAGMALVLPFLPLYLHELGLKTTAEVEQWSGVAFGITFLMAAIVSPLWGRLADQYGRKVMLLRASLGMAVIMAGMGLVSSPWQLVVLRFLMGAVSGYISAAITLVATQTPKERSGWALGVLSTGHVSGGLIGPLLGGVLAEVMGLRHVFFVTSLFLFVAFLLTWFLLVETFKPEHKQSLSGREVWAAIPDRRLLFAIFLTSGMLQLAVLSIEPIVTVYVQQLIGSSTHVALTAGLVVAASGFANVMAAPRLGRLSDRVGPRKVLIGALLFGAVMMVPQGLVHNAWELAGLRFMFGMAAAGLIPSVNSLVRSLVPDTVAGRIYGYNQSAQYLGNIAGPVMGGFVAAHWGIPVVFFVTATLLVANAGWVWLNARRPEAVEAEVAEPAATT